MITRAEKIEDDAYVESLETKVWKLEAENRRLRSDLADAKAIGEEQVNDDSLWREAETPREECLAKELGRLHMVLKVCA